MNKSNEISVLSVQVVACLQSGEQPYSSQAKRQAIKWNFSGTSTGDHPESEICRCEQAFERIKIARDLDISFSLYLDSLVSCPHCTLVASHGGSILVRAFFVTCHRAAVA